MPDHCKVSEREGEDKFLFKVEIGLPDVKGAFLVVGPGKGPMSGRVLGWSGRLARNPTAFV
jgi:hypothetical protein